MEPSPDRRQEPRRSTDAEIAEMGQALHDVAGDVRELKELLNEKTIPRIANLEEWRVITAATEFERERNRQKDSQSVISKRQFWIGITSIVVAMLGSAAGLASLVLAHT